jgi:hypothetical protein
MSNAVHCEKLSQRTEEQRDGAADLSQHLEQHHLGKELQDGSQCRELRRVRKRRRFLQEGNMEGVSQAL